MSDACARRSTAATTPTRSAPCAAPVTRWTIASARRRNPSHASSPERPAVAPHIGGLIGDARMIGAVGQAGQRLAAAEEEVGAAGIADRPAAGVLVELEQRAALTDRDDIVD